MKSICTSLLALATALFLLLGCSDTSEEHADGNSAPVAYDKTVATELDTLRDVTVSADDADSDILTFNMNKIPAHGTAVKIGINEWRYTPDTGFSGADSFTFRANDGRRDSNTATVTILVNQSSEQPLVQDQSISVIASGSGSIFLEGEDPLGLPLNFYIFNKEPEHGNLEYVGDNEFVYTPVHTDGNEYPLSDSFTFIAHNGVMRSNVGTVYITIELDDTNEPPVAHDLNYTIDEDTDLPIHLTDMYSDPDNTIDEVEVTITGSPGNGSVVFDEESGSWVYTPADNFYGTDFFTFEVTDAALNVSNEATVDIQIDPVNDAPVAFDKNVSVVKGNLINIVLEASDVDNTDILYTTSIVAFPEIYNFIQSSSNTWIFRTDTIGQYTFTYTVSDGFLNNAAIVTIDVTPEDIVYVKNDALGNNDGTSWYHAFTHPQDAIDASVEGEEIRVAQGIYKPKENYNAVLILKENVVIRGGYNPSLLYDSINNPEEYETILDGLDIVTGENVNHVITGAEDAVIDGFIVINGDASGNSDEGHGGGLFFNGTSMTISNCTFKNNSAVYGGGIFFDEDSAPVLDNCIFETNQAHYGGAIYLGKNSAPSLDECEFINNSASSDGGALFMGVNTAPDIRLMMNDLIFTGNNANGLGGALCALGIVHISNNTFSGNHAQMGGAIFVQNNETLISATAFDGNNAERDGGALYNFWSLSMDSDSSFTNNSAGGNGGALYNDASVTPEETITVDVEGVLFEGNRAAGLGGSLFINRGPGSYNGCVFNASNGGLITQHANKGGAVYNDRGSAEFINCEFEGFTALEGGAIYNNTVTSVYTGCSFLNNLSDAGGAVYNSGGLPGFVQCSFSGNDASAEGGALYNTRSSFNIENSAITSNISPQGGGMYNNLCPAPLIINTEFRGNGNANSVGSAVYNYMSNTSLINDLLAGNGNIPLFNNTSSPRIIHCTIAWNGNYAVYNSNGSMPVIINSVLCSNPYYLRIQRDKMASEGDPVIQIFDEDETDSADVSNSCLYQTDGNYAGSQNNILQAVEFYTVDHYKMRYTWTETYVNSNDDTVTETVQNQCLDAGTVDIDSDILDEITGKMSIRSSLDEFIDLEGTDTIPDPGYHSVP